MLKDKITLDMLTSEGVSVLTQKVFIDELGNEFIVGDNHRCAYMNSKDGRSDIVKDLSEPYISTVLNLWGPTPIEKHIV